MNSIKHIPERVFYLINERVLQALKSAIENLPVDGTFDIVLRAHKKQRTAEHNAAMWAGMLKDIAEQAWVAGRQYDSEVWHEQLKQTFLPEGCEEDFEKRVIKGYCKWKELPSGKRICNGSTTKLTSYGMGLYMTECEAYAANELGVRFTARPQYEHHS